VSLVIAVYKDTPNCGSFQVVRPTVSPLAGYGAFQQFGFLKSKTQMD
jgi:hypothetical protein